MAQDSNVVIDHGKSQWSDLWKKEDFLAIWLGFTALTFWIAEHGIEQDDHRRLVILTALGTILGPMTGAIARNCQSCCLANSLSLLPD